MNRREKTLRLIDQEPGTNGHHSGDESILSDSELLEAYSRAISRIAETAGQAVVGITVRPSPRQCQDRACSGAGVVFSPEGYLLTNDHVVQCAEHITVTLLDGTVFVPELIGQDPATDTAVLRIEARGLPYLPFGNSHGLRVGQIVIAIGNPLGLKCTVTTGVVSAIGRSLSSMTGRLIEDVVQHTAPLNLGNSGGPLVDCAGCLVGINTALVPSAHGIGFAVPSATARWVAGQLLVDGKVRRGYVGVTGGEVRLEPWFSRRHKIPNMLAIQVDSVDPEGPASKAGVREGDLILSFDGEDITGIDAMYRLLSRWPVGKPITLTVARRRGVCEIDIIPTEADF